MLPSSYEFLDTLIVSLPASKLPVIFITTTVAEGFVYSFFIIFSLLMNVVVTTIDYFTMTFLPFTM